MGVLEVETFLSNPAQEGNVSASTQNHAFNAILFLERNLLKIESVAPMHTLLAKRTLHSMLDTRRSGDPFQMFILFALE